MRLEISWELYNRESERHGSGTPELLETTLAKAKAYVEREWQKRERGSWEVDRAVISELGDFKDEDGYPISSKILAVYGPVGGEWEDE
jgi:hypothetical protein